MNLVLSEIDFQDDEELRAVSLALAAAAIEAVGPGPSTVADLTVDVARQFVSYIQTGKTKAEIQDEGSSEESNDDEELKTGLY